MERHEAHAISAPLASRVGRDASAAQVAEAMATICQEIDDALAPVIGRKGVAALYGRSLHLGASVHPWLAVGPAGVPATIDTSALRAALSQQTGTAAAAGASAFLQAFHSLLTSLVGPSLTERLLRTVWAQPTSSPSAQDSST